MIYGAFSAARWLLLIGAAWLIVGTLYFAIKDAGQPDTAPAPAVQTNQGPHR